MLLLVLILLLLLIIIPVNLSPVIVGGIQLLITYMKIKNILNFLKTQ